MLKDSVILKKKREGIIHYIGKVKGKKGIWFGIEITNNKLGKHNGTSDDGIQYFKCRSHKGIFVLLKDILRKSGQKKVKKSKHKRTESEPPKDLKLKSKKMKKSSVPDTDANNIVDLSEMIQQKANDIHFGINMDEIKESETEEEVIHPLIFSDDKNDASSENQIPSPPQIEWEDECKQTEEESAETEAETIQKQEPIQTELADEPETKSDEAPDEKMEIILEETKNEPIEPPKKSKHERTKTDLEVFEHFKAGTEEKPKVKKRKKNGGKGKKRKASNALLDRISKFDTSNGQTSNAFSNNLNKAKSKKKKKKVKKKKVKKEEVNQQIEAVKEVKEQIDEINEDEIEPGSPAKIIEPVNDEPIIAENEEFQEMKSDIIMNDDESKSVDVCEEDLAKIGIIGLKKKVSSSSLLSLNSFSPDSDHEGMQSNEDNRISAVDELESNHVKISDHKSSACSSLSSLSPLPLIGENNVSFDDYKEAQNENNEQKSVEEAVKEVKKKKKKTKKSKVLQNGSIKKTKKNKKDKKKNANSIQSGSSSSSSSDDDNIKLDKRRDSIPRSAEVKGDKRRKKKKKKVNSSSSSSSSQSSDADQHKLKVKKRKIKKKSKSSSENDSSVHSADYDGDSDLNGEKNKLKKNKKEKKKKNKKNKKSKNENEEVRTHPFIGDDGICLLCGKGTESLGCCFIRSVDPKQQDKMKKMAQRLRQ